MLTSEIVVVGGGLGGLTASIALARQGHEVCLIERHALPRHKVCGEYLSREVVPLLKSFGIPLADAPEITRFHCCRPDGKTMSADLPLGGIGISRYALDFRMLELAKDCGVRVVFEQALGIETLSDQVLVRTQQNEYKARLLLASWGKRSNLDRESNRSFWGRKSPWMAVKMHFDAVDFPEDEVGLYFFEGGYAGCSLTETGQLNFCCLVQKKQYQSLGGGRDRYRLLIEQNAGLRERLLHARPAFDSPLRISEIDFGPKEKKAAQTLYCGDAAHLIHPLCGNGMAMAIHSGNMAAGFASQYLKGSIRTFPALANAYTDRWKQTFSARLRWGRVFQSLLTHPLGMQWAMHPVVMSPGLLKAAISRTHGKTIAV